MVDATQLEQLARETRPLSPRELARRADLAPSTIYTWIESGKLPATKVGGRWQVRPADLLTLIQPAHAAPSPR